MIGMPSRVFVALAKASPAGLSTDDLIAVAYADRKPPREAQAAVRSIISRTRAYGCGDGRRIETVRVVGEPTVYRLGIRKAVGS